MTLSTPPDSDAREFGALVAAQMLYDFWRTERNVQLSAIEGIEYGYRLVTELKRSEKEPPWPGLTKAQKDAWIERGQEAVDLILRTEQFA